MPAYCQRCGKKFQDTSRVLNHMNQPYSSCRTYFEEILQITKASSRPEANQETSDFNSSSDPTTVSRSPKDGPSSEAEDDPMEYVPDPTIDKDHPMEDVPDLTSDNVPDPTSDSNPFFQEFFPGASHTFGSGQTFMDIFDNDMFSEQREQFPYYPFASKDEWELASFLLRSGLSMAAIDKFFKLVLVRYCLCYEKLVIQFISGEDTGTFIFFCEGPKKSS